MRLYNVELNESNSKYTDYLKWFVSLDYERQLNEFLKISRKANEDFHRYVMNKPRKFCDTVEKFFIIDDYITNNNLCDKF